MSKRGISRRNFLGSLSAAGVAAAGASAFIHPMQAAAQAVGVKPGDLADLTIKEAKVYVANIDGVRKFNSPENGWIFSLVTHSGIEGNYTDGNRGTVPDWLAWAKATCVGKNLFDLLPMIPTPGGAGGGRGAAAGRGAGGGPATSRGARGAAPATGPGAAAGGRGPAGGGGGGRGGNFVGGFGFATGRGPAALPTAVDFFRASIDIMLWDILGKAVNQPIYKLLGGTKDRMLAYCSSQHLATVEDYEADVKAAMKYGFKGYKIHPGGGQHKSGPAIPKYMGHIEEIKLVRKTAGDDYSLLFDPVQGLNLFEALRIGRALDEYDYLSFEDPLPSTDIDGLIELREKLDVPVEVGEFLYSIYDYGDYIRRGAMDVVRLIADNIGGISGSHRVAQLADAFGMPCTPHNWGNGFDLAVHFQLELASPNCYWFEMPNTPEMTDRAYMKDKFRLNPDGYVLAPTNPGLGYPLDRDALDKIMIRVDR